MKKYIKFLVIITFTHLITYYIAGIIAQLFLGAKEFYPPSSNALPYLKDPHDLKLQLLIIPAQIIRGLSFGIVLLPIYPHIIKLGRVKGSLMIGTLILVLSYVVASGGLLEHLVYFKPEFYPLKFALITFIEILFQSILLSLSIMIFLKRDFFAPKVKNVEIFYKE